MLLLWSLRKCLSGWHWRECNTKQAHHGTFTPLKQPLRNVLRLDCMQASSGNTPVQAHWPGGGNAEHQSYINVCKILVSSLYCQSITPYMHISFRLLFYATHTHTFATFSLCASWRPTFRKPPTITGPVYLVLACVSQVTHVVKVNMTIYFLNAQSWSCCEQFIDTLFMKN